MATEDLKTIPLRGSHYRSDADDGRFSFSKLSRTIATVTVGEGEEDFYIHLELLCKHSHYFDKLFKGQFKEGGSTLTTLRDVDVPTWTAFMDFVYNVQPILSYSKSKHYRIDESAPDLTELYIFADKYDVPSLRTRIVSAVWRVLLMSDPICKGPQPHRLPPCKDIGLAFGNLPETSPLCRLFVDIHCRNYDDDKVGDMEKEARLNIPVEFDLAVTRRHEKLRKLMVKGDIGVMYDLNMKDYREGESEPFSCLCSFRGGPHKIHAQKSEDK
ncbi:hypothetical protein BDV95DRAFT_606017 [Massariosphaeria phaeospora]|uniref:BTB domain-containing protein n=1 Tax=Massariosphaeria phaeospora TaxID=100035 RepID=A0A7C8MAZ9_9PLEO|nr:hypothetical protein BDV95DRAFT_606017 [Massariosphaeria phaeospora]